MISGLICIEGQDVNARAEEALTMAKLACLSVLPLEVGQLAFLLRAADKQAVLEDRWSQLINLTTVEV